MQETLFSMNEEIPQIVKRAQTIRAKECEQPALIESIGPYSINTVECVDCIFGMKQLPDRCIDIALVDPPYNVSKGGIWKWDNSIDLPGFGGNWDKVMQDWDDMPLAEYLAFTLSWLSEIKRIVRPTGSVWIHGTYHNIGIINFALQLLEMEIINEVVWYKRNSFPNLSGRRLTASHETILWTHTGKKRQYYFNYKASKEMDCLEDHLKTSGKQMRTVWDIPNNKNQEELRYGKHPTQKPIRLLKRMLSITSKPGQVCLVPFAGSGSECVAAVDLGLQYIAFEIEEEYIKICQKRLVPNLDQSLFKEYIVSSSSPPELAKPFKNKSSPSKQNIPSLIKWTGSKRSQASIIASNIPSHYRYFEPFIGSGALLYLMSHKGAVAGDVYEPLIDLWNFVQSKPEALIANYREQWNQLQNDRPGYFYVLRDRFNTTHNALDLNFLLRTCVNGIVRFNDSGQFNNSFHLTRPGMHPDRFEKIVKDWHKKVQNVSFVCQDYAVTLHDARAGDFVYLDPPYLGNKQRYTQNIDTIRFFTVLEDLNCREIKWALSFDGKRGGTDLSEPLPVELYKHRILIESGNSSVGKVLNGPLEMVEETLYMNY